MIYVLSICKERFVKIGFTEKPIDERISQLQTGSPFKITNILTTYGTILQELEIHRALTTAFIRAGLPIIPNEWYQGGHPITQGTINALRDGGPNQALCWLDKHNPANKQWGKRGERQPVYRWVDK